jgi:hypothetical protein
MFGDVPTSLGCLEMFLHPRKALELGSHGALAVGQFQTALTLYGAQDLQENVAMG